MLGHPLFFGGKLPVIAEGNGKVLVISNGNRHLGILKGMHKRLFKCLLGVPVFHIARSGAKFGNGYARINLGLQVFAYFFGDFAFLDFAKRKGNGSKKGIRHEWLAVGMSFDSGLRSDFGWSLGSLWDDTWNRMLDGVDSSHSFELEEWSRT